MISPNDPRHGKQAGYSAGCREACCRRGHALYRAGERADKATGHRRMLDATGTHRRIRALQRIGYSEKDLATRLGRCDKYVCSVLRFNRLRASTVTEVAALYDQLCMTWPTGWSADRNRRRAEARGWPSPLAWDEDTIDAPNARPALDADAEDVVDQVAVWRRMQGDKTVRLTQPECDELVRLCLAARWPHALIEERCGVNVHRSQERLAGVAA